MQPTRRKLFCQGGVLAAFGFVRRGAAQTARAADAGALQIGPNIYESIGVRPIVNCRETFIAR